MIVRLYLMLIVVALTGCTSARSIFDVNHGDASQASTTDSTTQDVDREGESGHSGTDKSLWDTFEDALRAELTPWHGTPHVLGGTSTSGVDCSGLIQRVYADLVAVDVPRTTEELIREGKRVRKADLKAGDLVFFSPSGKIGSHVGIYLSNNEFTHASSSRGVMTSGLDESYWKKYYETSRRIIEDEEWLLRAVARFQERQSLARDLQSE